MPARLGAIFKFSLLLLFCKIVTFVFCFPKKGSLDFIKKCQILFFLFSVIKKSIIQNRQKSSYNSLAKFNLMLMLHQREVRTAAQKTEMSKIGVVKDFSNFYFPKESFSRLYSINFSQPVSLITDKKTKKLKIPIYFSTDE